MKKLIPIFFLSLFSIVVSCGNNEGQTSNDEIVSITQLDSIKTDSTNSALKRIRTLTRKDNKLAHIDTYKIGNLKGIEFNVQKMKIDNDSLICITLRKDCGGEYYYSWEDGFLMIDELPSLYESVNTIKSNLARETDHKERYYYATEDDITVVAENEGKGWTIKISVDNNKNNSYISVSPAEIDSFIQLLQKAESKSKELQK